jgi:hypothetical protein
MKIAIESTTKIVTLNGMPARVWEGRTASGIPVHCYVTRIAVHDDDDCTEFKRELQEHRAPSPDVQGIPHRLIL